MRRIGTHQAERQGDQANNVIIWSTVLGGQKERREQITCSGHEDATIWIAQGKTRTYNVRNQVIGSYRENAIAIESEAGDSLT